MMTKRERVAAVLNHKQPDRVPLGLGGCETEGLHAAAYGRLQKILGITPSPPRIDTFMCNAVFEAEMMEAVGADILLVASPRMCSAPIRGRGHEKFWKPQELWGKNYRVPVNEIFSTRADGALVWETAGGSVCPAGGWFFDLESPTDLCAEFEYPDPDDYNPPDDLPDQMLRQLEDTAHTLYNETEYALCLGETITDLQFAPGGLVGSMILMLEKPELMCAYLQKAVDAALRQLKLLEQAVGRYVDILSIAQDFGDNRGLTIGAPLWREIYKPYYKQLFTGWHQISRMKINFHSCGAVRDILSDLIACGLDILNPVQVSAEGMEPQGLKKDFGDSLVFWGGDYDAQLNPKTDSYETVYNRVAQNLEILKQGGGHIFSGVHNLPADTPDAHLSAILDAWRDHSLY